MILYATPFASPLPSTAFLNLKQGNSNGRPKDAVFVAAVPLRAPKGPAQLLLSAAYDAGLWDLQHFMVIISSQSSSSHHSQVSVFDFQPEDPESFYAAFAVLAQKEVPGVVMRRKLLKVPSKRCWFVGYSNSEGVNLANKFSDQWPTNLIVGEHDCRHFTNEAKVSLDSFLRQSPNILLLNELLGNQAKEKWKVARYEERNKSRGIIIQYQELGIGSTKCLQDWKISDQVGPHENYGVHNCPSQY